MSSMKTIDQVLEIADRIQTLERKLRQMKTLDAPQMVAQLETNIERLKVALSEVAR